MSNANHKKQNIMTKSEIVHRIEKYIPNCILKVYRTSKRYLFWKQQQHTNEKAIKNIRKRNEPIRVIFLVNDSAEWKYDSVYQLMEKDCCFVPMILVCPLIYHYTEQQATDIYSHTYNLFTERGYNVIKACENVYDESISVDELNPDIIFYSSLWTGYMHPK